MQPSVSNIPKGQFGGGCNRTACSHPTATWYNIATKTYYCEGCAMMINWPGGRQDTLRLFGREMLCTMGEFKPVLSTSL